MAVTWQLLAILTIAGAEDSPSFDESSMLQAMTVGFGDHFQPSSGNDKELPPSFLFDKTKAFEAMTKKLEKEAEQDLKKKDLKKATTKDDEKAYKKIQKQGKAAKSAVKAAKEFSDLIMKCESSCSASEVADTVFKAMEQAEDLVTLFSTVGPFMPAVAILGQVLVGFLARKETPTVPTLTFKDIENAAQKALRSFSLSNSIVHFETLYDTWSSQTEQWSSYIGPRIEAVKQNRHLNLGQKQQRIDEIVKDEFYDQMLKPKINALERDVPELLNAYKQMVGREDNSFRKKDLITTNPFDAGCNDPGKCGQGATNRYLNKRDQKISSDCLTPWADAKNRWADLQKGLAGFRYVSMVLTMQASVMTGFFQAYSTDRFDATIVNYRNNIAQILEANQLASATLKKIETECEKPGYALEQKCTGRNPGECNYAWAMPSCNPGEQGRVTLNEDHRRSYAEKACQQVFDWNHPYGFASGGLMQWKRKLEHGNSVAEHGNCGDLFSWGFCSLAWEDYYLLAIPEYCLSQTCSDVFKEDKNWLP